MKRVLVLAALLSACASDQVAGTASQTGNSVVAGRLLASDSTPVGGAPVKLAPAAWTRDSSSARIRVVLTDSVGTFRFDGIDPGVWRFESLLPRASVVRNLRVDAGRDSLLPPLVGGKPGTLVTEVHLNDSLRACTFVVLGTTIVRSLKTPASEIYLSIPDLPPGIHWLALLRPDGTPVRQAQASVHSGRVDTLRNPEWTGEWTGPEPDDDDDGDED